MANQLKMAMVHTIEALFRQGWSRRRIAREVGLHRETVGKYIQQLTQGPPKPAKVTLGKEADSGPPEALSAEMGPAKPATKVTPGMAGVPSKCEALRDVILPKLELVSMITASVPPICGLWCTTPTSSSALRRPAC